jgi:hypothetical protein
VTLRTALSFAWPPAARAGGDRGGYLGRAVLLVSDDARELTSNDTIAMHDRGGVSPSLTPVLRLPEVLDRAGPGCVLTSDAGGAELRVATRWTLTRVYVHGRARRLRLEG